VSVSDVVNPNGLSTDSMILAYDPASGDFNGWTYASDKSWDALQTVTVNGVSVREAKTTELSPGDAFWLMRPEPSTPGNANPTNYIYLVGRYTGGAYATDIAGGTTEEAASTLVANPTMYDIDLNQLRFTVGEPAPGDWITVQNLAGQQTIYFRNPANTEWGRNIQTKVGKRIVTVWTSGGTIPSGTGFWYKRTAEGALRIEFDGAE
jgi:hypothetical protein